MFIHDPLFNLRPRQTNVICHSEKRTLVKDLGYDLPLKYSDQLKVLEKFGTWNAFNEHIKDAATRTHSLTFMIACLFQLLDIKSSRHAQKYIISGLKLRAGISNKAGYSLKHKQPQTTTITKPLASKQMVKIRAKYLENARQAKIEDYRLTRVPKVSSYYDCYNSKLKEHV